MELQKQPKYKIGDNCYFIVVESDKNRIINIRTGYAPITSIFIAAYAKDNYFYEFFYSNANNIPEESVFENFYEFTEAHKKILEKYNNEREQLYKDYGSAKI